MSLSVVPTILTKSADDLREKLDKVKELFSRVQVDIVDGKFRAECSLTPEAIESHEGLQLDFHLMVVEPIEWVERCRKVGANLIIGQIEMMSNQIRFIEQIRLGNMKAGLAVDLDTPIAALDSEALRLVDHVLLMGYKAGFGGEVLEPSVLGKIESMKRILTEGVELGLDGGINETNIQILKNLGVNVANVGKFLWQAPDLKGQKEKLE